MQIKFCGMMRTADVNAALDAGAGYVGAILAGGPRHLSRAQALETLRSAEGRAKRVAVIPLEQVELMASNAAGFDVAQIHGDASPETVNELRARFDGEVWAVVRSDFGEIPAYINDLYSSADAVVFDKKSLTGLGGSGQRLDWTALAQSLAAIRRGRTILAGGLKPDNVGAAILALNPDVVDVSSGVEQAPGIKDHNLIRSFSAAVSAMDSAK